MKKQLFINVYSPLALCALIIIGATSYNTNASEPSQPLWVLGTVVGSNGEEIEITSANIADHMDLVTQLGKAQKITKEQAVRDFIDQQKSARTPVQFEHVLSKPVMHQGQLKVLNVGWLTIEARVTFDHNGKKNTQFINDKPGMTDAVLVSFITNKNEKIALTSAIEFMFVAPYALTTPLPRDLYVWKSVLQNALVGNTSVAKAIFNSSPYEVKEIFINNPLIQSWPNDPLTYYLLNPRYQNYKGSSAGFTYESIPNPATMKEWVRGQWVKTIDGSVFTATYTKGLMPNMPLVYADAGEQLTLLDPARSGKMVNAHVVAGRGKRIVPEFNKQSRVPWWKRPWR